MMIDMDWMAVFLIGLVSGVCFTAIFMTWRDQERHTERPDGKPKGKKETEEYYELDPEPGAGPHAPAAHQEPAAAPSKGDELLARLDAPAVVFGEAGGESAEDLLGGTGSPPVREPPRAPIFKPKLNYKKGRCRYCSGEYANISSHEHNCKMRKDPRTRKPRATKAEMVKRRAITDRATEIIEADSHDR